jgi:hypothetical protein
MSGNKVVGANRSFSQVGGIRIGRWGATIPYAVLSGDQVALSLASFGRESVFHVGWNRFAAHTAVVIGPAPD